MTTHYTRPITNWTPISNDLIRDTTISSDALRVLLYALSGKPEWEYTAKKIGRAIGISEELARKALKQLVDRGYATKVQRPRVGAPPVQGWDFHWPARGPVCPKPGFSPSGESLVRAHPGQGVTAGQAPNTDFPCQGFSPTGLNLAGLSLGGLSPAREIGADIKTINTQDDQDSKTITEQQPAAPAARGAVASSTSPSPTVETSTAEGGGGAHPVLDEKPKARKRKTHTFETDKPLILAALDKQEKGEALKPAEVALIGWAAYCGHFENKVAAYATTRKKLMPAFTQTAKDDGTTAEELMYAVDAWLNHPRVTVKTSANAFRAFGLTALQERRAKPFTAVSGPSERGVGTRHQASADNYNAALAEMTDEELAKYLDSSQLAALKGQS